MGRNVTLSTLVEQLRAEIGASTSTAQGIGSLPALQQTLRRTQERLYNEVNWPHMLIERDQTTQAGQRYYTFPSDVNFDRIIDVYIKWAATWERINHGFVPSLYNLNDSDLNRQVDPVKLWRHYEDNQYEVWPVPASAGQTIRFRCIRNLRPLIANDDQCDLDATMIVLFAAAEFLQRLKSDDAPTKLGIATQYYKTIKGNLDKNGAFIMGGHIRAVQNGWPGGNWELRTKPI